MSVNMNVFRAETGTAAAILGVAQLALGGFDIDPGAEPAELVEGGVELQVGVVVVVERRGAPATGPPAPGRPRTASRPRASR